MPEVLNNSMDFSVFCNYNIFSPPLSYLSGLSHSKGESKQSKKKKKTDFLTQKSSKFLVLFCRYVDLEPGGDSLKSIGNLLHIVVEK